MLDFDIITCDAYLGNKWAPPAHVWWLDERRHVPELCCAVLDPTFGPMSVVGPSVLIQHQEGGKD